MADRRAVSFIPGVGGSVPLGEIGPTDRLVAENVTVGDNFGLPSGIGFPGAPDTGDLFWRTDTNELYRYNGASWDATTLPSIAQTVTVAKSGGDFTSVKDAIASITDATSTKPYIVQVYPGVYLEDPFTMKAFVTVHGEGDYYSTRLETTDNNAHFITGVGGSMLQDVAILGPTGVGFAAVDYTESSLVPFSLWHAVIVGGYYGVWCHPTGSRGVLHAFFLGNYYAGTNMNQFLRVTDYGAMVTVNTAFMSGAPGAVHTGIYCSGANATFSMDMGTFRNVGSTDGLFVDQGGEARLIGCSFTEGTNAIHVGSTGTGSSVICTGTEIRGAFTKDIWTETPNCTVSFSGGVAARSKLDIAVGTSFIGSFVDDASVGSVEGQVVVGELWLGDSVDNEVPLATWTRDVASTGLSTGGSLSRGAGLDLDVGVGTGFIRTTLKVAHIEWIADTLTLTANSTLWITVDAAGVIAETAAAPNHSTHVVLGTAITDTTGIIFVAQHSVELVQHNPATHRYAKEVVGPISVSGMAATKAGSPSLQIDVDSGNYYIYDNHRTAVAHAPILFVYWYRDGSGGWKYVTAQTAIDPNYYDNGLGTLAAMNPGEFKKDLLFASTFDTTTEYHIVYGQQIFASQLLAEVGPNPAAPSEISTDALRLAGIVVDDGATDISSIVDQRPRLGQFSSGATAVTDHGLLSGLADDDHTQYQLRSEEGVANGYPSLNGSIQVPTAQLPFTATPPADVDTNAPVVGTSTEIARADHKHDTAVAVPVTATGATNTEGTSVSLARADHIHALGGPPAGGAAPGTPSAGDLWFNTTAGWQTLMAYDASRSKWLSAAEFKLGLGHDTADGNYMRGDGITGAAGVGTGVLLPRNATIKRISARARAGLATKTFDLLIDDVSALSFSLVASEYTHNTVDIDVAEGERVWVSASAVGAIALDVTVALWVSWRV